ncbi:hypothetical protein G432_18435 [Sphingomonas sp. MM-1]|uniref:hypothetical protein n=1 Tax=Sphingomonas sp. MM-1 TaxID=745310 RepID=UPI0002C0E033|nr:hypothetical protein [Sphingomonas sp. MM-1]AGH51405.1 hypothetical protein G432_18435 [Sphingomonas sp. MM-1]
MSGKNRNEIPDYTDTAEMREALRRASKQLSARKRMSYREQREAIADVAAGSNDVVNDFAAGKTQRHNDDRFLPALWDMIAARHPAMLTETWRAVRIEQLIGSDSLTNALHDFFLPGMVLDRNRLAQLQGHYAAFAPFFLNEHDVALMALECGVDDNPGTFALEMHYRDRAKRDRRDRIEGRIIPAGENVLFVGQITGQQTPYIFTLSGFPIADGRIERSEGVVLVGSRGERASSYPIVILCRDEPAEPRVISADDAAERIPEWEAVAPVFAHGIVRWE